MKYIGICSSIVIPIIVLSLGCGGSSDTPEDSATPTSDDSREEGVFVSPALQDVELGDKLIMKVEVALSQERISGGEIRLEFDPDVMKVVGVEPGNLLGNEPLVGLEWIDNETGVFMYALARQGPTSSPTPSGVFASVELEVLEGAESGDYNIELTSVGLADEEFEEIRGIEVGHAVYDVEKETGQLKGLNDSRICTNGEILTKLNISERNSKLKVSWLD